MSSLDKINGECLSVPGLRIWGARNRPNRFSIIAQNSEGAVELWQEMVPLPLSRIMHEDSYGGVEIHRPNPLEWRLDETPIKDCMILGGDCYTDGSSLAFFEIFTPLIKSGDSRRILERLIERHEDHFGPPSIEQKLARFQKLD